MNRIDFYTLLTAKPFRPFRMRLSLNITADVRHPEMAILEDSTFRIEPPTPRDEPMEKVTIVSLAHIITVEYLPTALA
jgi:hypothetical protein